ncbi:Ras GTPase [Pelomyxa schiedti]|nr:Ras GTPase [Pelomyxa schiedti]
MALATYRIVVVGSGGVGKSALVIQLIEEHFIDEYDPTAESGERRWVIDNDPPCIMDILDTCEEDYSAMRDQYMRTAQSFIFVYSITSRSSLEHLMVFREYAQRAKDNTYPAMVLCGNKYDLESERRVSTEEGTRLALDWKCPFRETSAKTRFNVEEVFFEAVRVIRRYQSAPPLDTKKPEHQKCSLM